jgi:nucleotide-binding universal stress UspA family protein
MVIGVDQVVGSDGRFSRTVEELAAGFEGPLALVLAKDPAFESLPQSTTHILVPVSGSGVSQRGAEIAIAIAHASGARLHLVYVSTTRDEGTRRGTSNGAQERQSQVLSETAAAAARYELEVTTSIRNDAAPEQAIIEEIDAVAADLVVLGVDRLQGDKLDFGAVAAFVLARSPAPVLLVSTESSGRKAARPAA